MKKILILLLLITLSKCSKEPETKVDNTYKVLSVLYDDFITYHMKTISINPPTPPAPNSDVSWDSIKKKLDLEMSIPKDTIRKMDSLIRKDGRLIVAINPTLFIPYTDNIKNEHLKKYLINYGKVFSSFRKIKDTLPIDVSKIPVNKYSYIFPYQEYFDRMTSKGYDKYDIIINFSRIAFNENNTKAIVIMGVGFGKLNGFSAMYFLEKKNDKWYIKYEKGLTIS